MSRIFTSNVAPHVFHDFASIAQFERKKISERTKEGLASARKRGRIGGRLSALTTVQKDEVRWMRDAACAHSREAPQTGCTETSGRTLQKTTLVHNMF